MNLIPVVLVLLLLAAVLLVISAPLRPPAGGGPRDPGGEPAASEPPGAVAARERREHEREQLEAAREAKYREIRDAELDYRTGKLSRADYEAIDGALRAEALEILTRLEREQERDDEEE